MKTLVLFMIGFFKVIWVDVALLIVKKILSLLTKRKNKMDLKNGTTNNTKK